MKRTLRQIYTPGTLLDGAMAVSPATEASLPHTAFQATSRAGLPRMSLRTVDGSPHGAALHRAFAHAAALFYCFIHVQDACGGSQPLLTLWEGEHLRFGACVVDVQSATIRFTAWQVGLPWLRWPGAWIPLLQWGLGSCESAAGCHRWLVQQTEVQTCRGVTQPAVCCASLPQEADTQRTMLQALLLQADPAEARRERGWSLCTPLLACVLFLHGLDAT